MENTQEQKTPEQWFQMLREPYRSEAIANIDKEYTFFKDYPESLEDALENSFNFFDHDQAKWIKIFNSIRAGETTYLEHEKEEPTDWETKYNELKAKYEKLLTYNDELTERINQTEIKNNQEKIYFYWADRQYYCNVEKQEAIDNSDNFSEIYEAVCIGKKKSVLVNE